MLRLSHLQALGQAEARLPTATTCCLALKHAPLPCGCYGWLAVTAAVNLGLWPGCQEFWGKWRTQHVLYHLHPARDSEVGSTCSSPGASRGSTHITCQDSWETLSCTVQADWSPCSFGLYPRSHFILHYFMPGNKKSTGKKNQVEKNYAEKVKKKKNVCVCVCV